MPLPTVPLLPTTYHPSSLFTYLAVPCTPLALRHCLPYLPLPHGFCSVCFRHGKTAMVTFGVKT